MRKIVAGLFVALDGVVEAPNEWTGRYFNEEAGQTVRSMIAAGDTMLLGRVTYQGFAAAFGGDTSDPMAATMNEGEGDQVALKLAASQTSGTGVVHLTYQKA